MPCSGWGRPMRGGGVIPQDDNLAIMWLARAAALGHRIAAYQLEQLRAGCR